MTTDEILSMISSAKCSGKKSLKVKVYQVEFFPDRHPKILLQTLGIDKIEESLQNLGYEVKESKTKKQVSVQYKADGHLKKVKSRDLYTTNLEIKW